MTRHRRPTPREVVHVLQRRHPTWSYLKLGRRLLEILTTRGERPGKLWLSDVRDWADERWYDRFADLRSGQETPARDPDPVAIQPLTERDPDTEFVPLRGGTLSMAPLTGAVEHPRYFGLTVGGEWIELDQDQQPLKSGPGVAR